jgi:tRNA-2-methylthio-N6-dimethylallyladenosine synthase
MRGQVPEDVKVARLAALQALIIRQQGAFNRAQEGRVLDVLFESAGRKPGQIAGRSPYLQPVHVIGAAALIGSVRPVRIKAALANSLSGELVEAG